MADHRPDILLRPSGLAQQLGAFPAVLLRELLVVQVVDQADDAPFLFILALFFRHVAHDGFNRKCVLYETFIRVVTAEKLEGFLSCRDFSFHKGEYIGSSTGTQERYNYGILNFNRRQDSQWQALQ